MSESKQYLTSEKLAEFKKELQYLTNEKRKEIAENLEYTKKMGDLAENAEYHEARQAQGEIEDRISHLENLIKTALIVDNQKTDTATIGSNVRSKKIAATAKRVK